jgi:peptidoglycan/xylan/chitin deacetylase (PgdA/CDA1 family)
MPDQYRGPNVARRRMLVVAAGGVLVGLGTVFKHGNPQPANAAQVGAVTKDSKRPATPKAARPSPSASPSATRHPDISASSSPTATAKPAAKATAGPAKTPAAGKPVYYVDDGDKAIALTIDDGPSPVYTPEILRILDRYGVQATFSMVGQNVTYYPSVAREVAQAGHTIINHTWNHANLPSLSTTSQISEISRATDAIHSATGVHPRMFRAPYGAWSKESLAYCAAHDLIALDWSVDPEDWARPGVSKIVRTIMKTTQTGSIILEHDGGGDRSETVAALKIAIPRLLDEGYKFAIP